MTARGQAAAVAGTVYVMVPVHNRRAITESYVRSLAAQTDRGVQLVLIDDGSTDGTADAVRDIMPDAIVITGKGDWWFGGALRTYYRPIPQSIAPNRPPAYAVCVTRYRKTRRTQWAGLAI